jgi:cytidylate kinase
MSLPSIIAIDGPAASGKSTIGAMLADKLGYVYFDTGVMYRAVTWAALQRGIDISNEGAIVHLAEALIVDVRQATVDDGRQYTVLADGVDVTWDLRRPDVNQHVSPVSAYPGVRRALTVHQRRIGVRGRMVMVGRDIGTIVLPEADLKVYLDADVAERSRRRYREVVLRAMGVDPSTEAEGLTPIAYSGPEFEAMYEAMVRRDRIDSSRKVAPLRPADDAVIIDTTELTIGQVMERVLALARCREAKPSEGAL